MLNWFKKKPTNLKRMKSQISRVFNQSSNDPNILLKQATALKKSGDLNGAIEILRKAYSIINSNDIEYSVQVYLRLPMYLHAAGRNDETWSEFNKLITRNRPNSRNSRSVLLMEHSTIYDKMRLFLQREGKLTEAVNQGILSYISVAQGRYYQVREFNESEEQRKQADEIISKKFIKSRVQPLLKKADKLDKLEDIVNILLEEFVNFPKVNKNQILCRITSIMKECN